MLDSSKFIGLWENQGVLPATQLAVLHRDSRNQYYAVKAQRHCFNKEHSLPRGRASHWMMQETNGSPSRAGRALPLSAPQLSLRFCSSALRWSLNWLC